MLCKKNVNEHLHVVNYLIRVQIFAKSVEIYNYKYYSLITKRKTDERRTILERYFPELYQVIIRSFFGIAHILIF